MGNLKETVTSERIEQKNKQALKPTHKYDTRERVVQVLLDTIAIDLACTARQKPLFFLLSKRLPNMTNYTVEKRIETIYYISGFSDVEEENENNELRISATKVWKKEDLKEFAEIVSEKYDYLMCYALSPAMEKISPLASAWAFQWNNRLWKNRMSKTNKTRGDAT